MAAAGDGPSGWFFPGSARKAHFDGGDGRALCSQWLRSNPFGGGEAPIEAGADAPPSRDECVACRRKLEAL